MTYVLILLHNYKVITLLINYEDGWSGNASERTRACRGSHCCGAMQQYCWVELLPWNGASEFASTWNSIYIILNKCRVNTGHTAEYVIFNRFANANVHWTRQYASTWPLNGTFIFYQLVFTLGHIQGWKYLSFIIYNKAEFSWFRNSLRNLWYYKLHIFYHAFHLSYNLKYTTTTRQILIGNVNKGFPSRFNITVLILRGTTSSEIFKKSNF